MVPSTTHAKVVYRSSGRFDSIFWFVLSLGAALFPFLPGIRTHSFFAPIAAISTFIAAHLVIKALSKLGRSRVVLLDAERACLVLVDGAFHRRKVTEIRFDEIERVGVEQGYEGDVLAVVVTLRSRREIRLEATLNVDGIKLGRDIAEAARVPFTRPRGVRRPPW